MYVGWPFFPDLMMKATPSCHFLKNVSPRGNHGYWAFPHPKPQSLTRSLGWRLLSDKGLLPARRKPATSLKFSAPRAVLSFCSCTGSLNPRHNLRHVTKSSPHIMKRYTIYYNRTLFSAELQEKMCWSRQAWGYKVVWSSRVCERRMVVSGHGFSNGVCFFLCHLCAGVISLTANKCKPVFVCCSWHIHTHLFMHGTLKYNKNLPHKGCCC